ncbi:MAG TPA: GNAT family N-acetyltransferase [Acidimicrobiia bacterium]|nr:GNAT family N-acetyltransferase [Acidimicrobiia bacterium]
MTLAPGGLAQLVAAALPDEGLTAADLETCCFGPDMQVLGDERAAAVLTVKGTGAFAAAWLVLLAVHPDDQRRGRGRELVAESARRARAAGAVDLHLGTAIPRYVWPGVDFRFTAALALFETMGFEPYGAACNMAITTSFRADAPAGSAVEREEGDGATALAARCFPHWRDEVERSVVAGTCYAARGNGETIGFACHSVNRAGWIGPMATDPERQRAGVGRSLLGAVCAALANTGRGVADIAWVGPIGFYAKAGATVSRVFRNAKLAL